MARKPAAIWSNLLRWLEWIILKIDGVLSARSAAIRDASRGGRYWGGSCGRV